MNFNVPTFTGNELFYMEDAIKTGKLSGDGKYTRLCSKWLEQELKVKKVLMTTSCTHALEMAAILCNIREGDEIIAPSYTFVSTVNAFVLRGAKIRFVDINKDTMNIEAGLIQRAINSKTKAIIVVHYAGVACEMDKICEVAKKNNLFLIEDAAQAIFSKYKGKALGTIGDIGVLSFHETKNYSMGEGGAILINSKKFIKRAEIIREKGTDRSRFFRGEIDKYSWVDIGSSFLPSELNLAYLYPQLLESSKINNKRKKIWMMYHSELGKLKEYMDIPYIPIDVEQNHHMFYIKLKDNGTREKLINYLKTKNILSVFHYIPLHSSEAGYKYGVFNGEDKNTTVESERILRLPIYYNMSIEDTKKVIEEVRKFFLAIKNEKIVMSRGLESFYNIGNLEKGFTLEHLRSFTDERDWEDLITNTFEFKCDINRDLKSEKIYSKERVFIIKYLNKIVGTASCWFREEYGVESAYLHMVAVNEKYRGNKLGEYLVKSVINEASLRGYKKIFLKTDEFREEAISLYKKLGFKMDKAPF